MKTDVFSRDLHIGDIIVCFPNNTGKNICVSTVTEF